MTEHKLPQGTLVVTKTNSEQSPDYTFMFTKDDMSEYYGKFVHAVVCEWHPLFGLDMSYFDDMLSTSPDVTVSTDCISIKYDMNINKKISTIEIKIYEKEHEGEVGLEDLLRDNKKLKKTIFKQKQRIDKLYELVLYSKVLSPDNHVDWSARGFGVDMFSLSIRSELEEGFNLNRMLVDSPKNFNYIGDNIINGSLNRTINNKFNFTYGSSTMWRFCIRRSPDNFEDISKRLVMLVPSLRKSKMYISGNSYRISELVLCLIASIVYFQVTTAEKTTKNTDFMTYDTSLILDFFISNGLNIKEVNEDGHTILDILNDKLHKYPPHGQPNISAADAVKKILNKYF